MGAYVDSAVTVGGFMVRKFHICMKSMLLRRIEGEVSRAIAMYYFELKAKHSAIKLSGAF